jgi:hypothetical protein
VSIVALPAVESPAEELAVEGGRNPWLCALSIVAGGVSIATGQFEGLLVSNAGVALFC